MTRDFTQPARERQEWRWDHASRHSRLTQRGPKKRDGVNEGHETSSMLQVRIGEVFAYRCVLSFQKGFLQSLHINIVGSSLNVNIAFAIDIIPYSSVSFISQYEV